MRVKSEWHIQKAKPYLSKKCEQLLKYGLHWDAVTSRWARELANEVGVLEITKNIPNLQVFGSKKFDYILCI